MIEIKTLKPNANISTTHDPALGTEGNCAWVSGTDPLFGEVADAWMKIMIEDFGTDHWYFFTFCIYANETTDYVRWCLHMMLSMLCSVPTGCRYQCDGFFTGMAPPWYDASNPESAVAPKGDTADVRVDAPPTSPIEADPAWTPVWEGAWKGMARTDPEAKWLYQGV